jgi:hypothetical protein
VDLDPLRSPASVGWFPDPLRRFDFRYFNGERWTADVSADGTRFIDPGPFTPPSSAAPRSGRDPGRHPSRTLAVLSLLLGLAGVALGWAPFIFVLGGAGSIAAVVLGVVSLRRTSRLAAAGAHVDHAGSGQRLAIAGICLGPIGLALCVVGAILTGLAYREFTEYVDPGPHRIEEQACTSDGPRVTYAGDIVNLDSDAHDYELLVQILDGPDIRANERVVVKDVAAGASGTWSTTVRVGDVGALDCRVRNVTGPYPFGLERNG